MNAPLAIETPLRSELEVVRHDGDATAWDAFVARTAGSSFCHCAAWGDVLREALGAECCDLVARDASGALRGVLPLARVRSRLFGDYLVSLPFLNAGGPIGDTDARERLTEEASALARELGVDLLELRTREAVGSGAVRVVTRKLTVLLTLPSAAAELWETFPAKLRSAGRKRRVSRRGSVWRSWTLSTKCSAATCGTWGPRCCRGGSSSGWPSGSATLWSSEPCTGELRRSPRGAASCGVARWRSPGHPRCARINASRRTWDCTGRSWSTRSPAARAPSISAAARRAAARTSSSSNGVGSTCRYRGCSGRRAMCTRRPRPSDPCIASPLPCGGDCRCL